MITAASFCLISALYFEARQFYKEPDAISAIATVILNRVEDPRYPDTVCEVVFEPKQFSFTHDGMSDMPRPDNAIDRRALKVIERIADEALAGGGFDLPSTHYHTVDVDPVWSASYDQDGLIGTHIFYTNNTPYR